MKQISILFLSLLLFLSGCAGLPEEEPFLRDDDLPAPAESSAEESSVPELPAKEPSLKEVPASATADDALKSARGEPAMSDEEMGFLTETGAPEGGAAESGGRSSTSSSRPRVSGLSAGFSDDNQQFGYFVRFLEDFEYVDHLPLIVSERIIIELTDAEGMPVLGAKVTVKDGGKPLESGTTMADGRYFFFPAEYSPQLSSYDVKIRYGNREIETTLSRQGPRTVSLSLEELREIPQQIPLDILFVMDTTGSMGEEIERLKTTIELIHLNLTSLSVPTDVRFGMVLYKDVEDEYLTEVIPMTRNLDDFQESLSRVEAYGGGDTPEDLQAALQKAVKTIRWNRDGIKLAFIITDAPPHLDYGQKYTYTDAVKDAKEMGIKFYGVGTGGLDLMGEYILRQIAQYTAGKYIFLTYGERGESEGGAPGSVSHHTGSNYETDKLEAIIIRFAREELSYQTDLPLEEPEPYFEAHKIAEEEREETLKILFNLAFEQLADFSTIQIPKGTALAILPLAAADEELAANAEYFTERLIMSGAEQELWTMVERKDLQSIIEELKLQLTGLTADDAALVGKLLNAEMLLTGSLYGREDQFELFLKLLRVETGEILSVTKAHIDRNLGL
jgi:Mg-chelatase subunit ChlD/PBP1b-binding outer membrane lipoprotein LpoB